MRAFAHPCSSRRSFCLLYDLDLGSFDYCVFGVCEARYIRLQARSSCCLILLPTASLSDSFLPLPTTVVHWLRSSQVAEITALSSTSPFLSLVPSDLSTPRITCVAVPGLMIHLLDGHQPSPLLPVPFTPLSRANLMQEQGQGLRMMDDEGEREGDRGRGLG